MDSELYVEEVTLPKRVFRMASGQISMNPDTLCAMMCFSHQNIGLTQVILGTPFGKKQRRGHVDWFALRFMLFYPRGTPSLFLLFPRKVVASRLHKGLYSMHG